MPPPVLRDVGPILQQEIQRHCGRALAVVGVCSLAVGTDQLFARAVLSSGGRLHVVIPCEQYEGTFDDVELPAFRSLRQRASKVEMLAHPAPGATAFFEAGRRVVELCDVLLTAWDGRDPDGSGGTADVVAYARSMGVQTVNVWPERAGPARCGAT